MNTKLHINLHQGVLEVEGEENFVREIFSAFKAELLKNPASKPSHSPGAAALPKEPTSNDNGKGKKETKRSKATAEPKIDKNLDLAGGSGTVSLKDYVAQYSPKTKMERNVVFVGYLKDILQIENVSIDHVWTCYSSLRLKYPGNPQQSAYDTSAKGWLNVPSLNNISVSIAGKNWLRDILNKVEKTA
jgi:hypothetical protein